MATLTAEQKIEKAHVAIMQSRLFRFYSGLTMIGKVEVRDDIPTAGTNGRDVFYGRSFVDSLSPKQMLFVVLHELSHIAWRHTTVWKHLYDEDKMLANCACDFVINLQIHDLDPNYKEIEFPVDANGNRIGLLDERFRGMDAQQVFNILKKECNNNETGQGQLEQGQFDEHDFESGESLSAAEKQELASRITQALHQGKQLAGKMDGDIPRDLRGLVEPQIAWQDVLRDLVKVVCKGSGDSSWRRFSKRHLAADIYLPQNIDQKVGRILNAVDTSGSIGDSLLSKFMSEMVSIGQEVNPEGMDLLYWDYHVQGHEFYTNGEYESMAQMTKPVGGGGTDPNCIVEYMNKEKLNPQVVVVLTDGYFGDMDSFAGLTMPVIWCVVDNPSFVPDFGKVVHIKE